MTGTPQPRVPPEAVSWCIDRFALARYESAGEITQKAHRVQDAERHGLPYHAPVCGAWMHHPIDHCAPAPALWPACRHCWRKADSVTVPDVFCISDDPPRAAGARKE